SVDLPGPVYFRIGRGRDPEVYPAGTTLQIGKAVEHGTGSDLTLIATGSMVHPALRAAAALTADGYDVGVLDMHTVKPLDEEAVLGAARRSRLLMTVEEHNVLGGLGGAVAEVISEHGVPVRLHRHGIRDQYSLIGPPTHLYGHYRLDAPGVEAEAREALLA
ncbi:transketolase C-terminal domain-containing protein, partial [Streptomyces asiaticus]